MDRHISLLFLAGLVLWRLSVGFSFLTGDEKQALEMVELFHERMNAGHFDEVYDDAHPAFRDAESRQEWLRHMKETREDLGLYRLRRSQTLNVMMGPPIQVRVYHHATFEQGDGTSSSVLLETVTSSNSWSTALCRPSGHDIL